MTSQRRANVSGERIASTATTRPMSTNTRRGEPHRARAVEELCRPSMAGKGKAEVGVIAGAETAGDQKVGRRARKAEEKAVAGGVHAPDPVGLEGLT